jgi:aldehyde dehydrogenase (NAD+)
MTERSGWTRRRTWELYIDGRWRPAAGGQRFPTYDPSTEAPVAEVAQAAPGDVEEAVAAARRAVEGPWRRLEPKARGQLLYDLSAALEAHLEEFAALETLDTGKPLDRSRREVRSTVRYFRYYAGAADKLHGEQIPLGVDYIDFTLREPMGVTAHIIPWNMPLNLIGRSVAPALAAGNSAVLKPAEETPLTALALAELFEAVGVPAGVYNVVPGPGAHTGAHLASSPGIDSITFTGSVETGRSVMRAAAEHVKPVVLELGGKSPSVVLADADLDLAAGEVIKGIYGNSGQFCNASARLLVDRRVREPLLERVLERRAGLRIGPGMDNPDMGPLISDRQYRRVLDYIRIGREEGAEVAAGGGRPAHLDRGWFVEPTVLDGVSPSARVAQEEIFGPVLSVLEVEDDDHAAQIADSTRFGLAAAIFTSDINRALRFATRVRAGQVYVNEYFAGGEETPFGGFKDSGFGREKGLEALHHYTQTKNVAIRLR